MKVRASAKKICKDCKTIRRKGRVRILCKILKQLEINPDTRVKDLTEDQANKLRTVIEKQYKVEGDLRRDILGNIKRLKEIGCYRGLRHAKKLPVRGQRSKTNSRTVRGNVKRTMGSGRKPAGQKT